MTTIVCTAPRHGRRYAYGPDRCNCPAAVNRRRHSRREYIPSRRPRCGIRGGYDQVAVDRAVAGDVSIRLTEPELVEAVRQLDAKGLSGAEIATVLGITTRTVQRHRARRRATQAAR